MAAGARGAGRGAQQAGATAPGGRGGPGSSPAFPRGAAAVRTALTPGAASISAVALSREPALVALAANKDADPLAPRASALLARLTWPGKPGAAPAAAPLTAEEQQRFVAGREVYQTLCAACHQPDGRGRELVAPPLVGSEFALGPAEIAVRIVLNGKEGSTGLMPPLGSALSDEQIAATLTYIRREWGHTASAVDAGDRQGRPRTVDQPDPPMDGGGAQEILNFEC